MLSQMDTEGKGFLLTKDITDIIRGRRDPMSPWAAQKSRWPPQRMKFLSDRFAGGQDKFHVPQLEAFCRYLHDTSCHDLSDELNAAWETVERLRAKAGVRESMAMGSRGPLLQMRA